MLRWASCLVPTPVMMYFSRMRSVSFWTSFWLFQGPKLGVTTGRGRLARKVFAIVLGLIVSGFGGGAWPRRAFESSSERSDSSEGGRIGDRAM